MAVAHVQDTVGVSCKAGTRHTRNGERCIVEGHVVAFELGVVDFGPAIAVNMEGGPLVLEELGAVYGKLGVLGVDTAARGAVNLSGLNIEFAVLDDDTGFGFADDCVSNFGGHFACDEDSLPVSAFGHLHGRTEFNFVVACTRDDELSLCVETCARSEEEFDTRFNDQGRVRFNDNVFGNEIGGVFCLQESVEGSLEFSPVFHLRFRRKKVCLRVNLGRVCSRVCVQGRIGGRGDFLDFRLRFGRCNDIGCLFLCVNKTKGNS